MQVRIKVRLPLFNIETEKFLVGTGPLGDVWFQLALTIPMTFGFDLEAATN